MYLLFLVIKQCISVYVYLFLNRIKNLYNPFLNIYLWN